MRLESQLAEDQRFALAFSGWLSLQMQGLRGLGDTSRERTKVLIVAQLLVQIGVAACGPYTWS